MKNVSSQYSGAPMTIDLTQSETNDVDDESHVSHAPILQLNQTFKGDLSSGSEDGVDQ